MIGHYTNKMELNRMFVFQQFPPFLFYLFLGAYKRYNKTEEKKYGLIKTLRTSKRNHIMFPNMQYQKSKQEMQ